MSFHPTGYFFADGEGDFPKLVEKALKTYRGTEGLPDEVSPTIPISLLCGLQEGLEEEIMDFVAAVHEVTVKVVKEWVEKLFPATAVLKKMMGFVNKLFEKKKTEAEEHIKNVLSYQNVIVTTGSELYIVKLENIRTYVFHTHEEEIAKEGNNEAHAKQRKNQEFEKAKQYLEAGRPGFLNAVPIYGNNLDLERKRATDLILRIFSFWNVMIQRLIDDVIIATRANLASELVENEMTPFFTKEFEEAGDPVELYAAHPKKKLKKNE